MKCLLLPLGFLISSVFCDLDQGLFAYDPNVKSLSDLNAKKSIYGQKENILAMYYVHYCGHCMKASEIVKELAKRKIHNWRPTLKLVAINCATYIETCKQMVVSYGFPQILMYPPNSKTESDAYAIHLEGRMTSDAMYTKMLEYFGKMKRGIASPILANSKEDICQSFTRGDKNGAYAIAEKTPSLDSAEIILNLLNYHKSVQIRRFYGNSELAIILSSMGTTMPAILKVNLDDCSFTHVNLSSQDMHEMKEQFTRLLQSQYNKDPNDEPDDSPTEKPEKAVIYKLSYIDMYNAMQYSIFVEFQKLRQYERAHIECMKEYSALMVKYFPFRNEYIKRFFTHLNTWLTKKTAETFTLADYLDFLMVYNWPRQDYRFCRGSKPHYRGFTCGQWVLFHALTVSEYANPPAEGVKHEVLPVMRTYTQLFFSCRDCAEHFANETANMESQLKHPNSSVLYLWQIHNLVNKRLETATYLDPCFQPKIQFPPSTLCENCWKDGQLDDSHVLPFLVNFYGQDSFSSTSSMDSKSNGNDSTTIEMSFACILFILISTYTNL